MNFEFEPVEAIAGAFVMVRPIHKDHRGNFGELYREGVLEEAIDAKFVQQNQSFSEQGVLRGLHIQSVNPQGKLVTCLYGEVLDVIIDLRPDSKTFLKSIAVNLSWDRGESIYAPPGCAHGFLCLSRYSIVHYNCTTFYDPAYDGGVSWDSPELVDNFGGIARPIQSAKDRLLPTVQQYLKEQERHA